MDTSWTTNLKNLFAAIVEISHNILRNMNCKNKLHIHNCRSVFLFFQLIINGIWMLVSPPKAIHHYPTRDDNLLVCSSYVDASYMIGFGYPIVLIVVCTVYAVLTRNIPEAFNESKHIGNEKNFGLLKALCHFETAWKTLVLWM